MAGNRKQRRARAAIELQTPQTKRRDTIGAIDAEREHDWQDAEELRALKASVAAIDAKLADTNDPTALRRLWAERQAQIEAALYRGRNASPPIEIVPDAPAYAADAEKWRLLAQRASQLNEALAKALFVGDIAAVRDGVATTVSELITALGDDQGVSFIAPELVCEIMNLAARGKRHPLTAIKGDKFVAWQKNPTRAGILAVASAVLEHFAPKSAEAGTVSRKGVAIKVCKALTAGGFKTQQKTAINWDTLCGHAERLQEASSRPSDRNNASNTELYLDRWLIGMEPQWYRLARQQLAEQAWPLKEALAHLATQCKASLARDIVPA